MKTLGLTVAAAVLLGLGSTVVMAQDMGVTIRSNDGAVRMRTDDGDGYRSRRVIRERRDPDTVVVRRHRDISETGSVGCKTVVIHERNDDGDEVTKRIRKCR